MLVDRGADLNYKSPEGVTPLILAVMSNNVQVAQYLLEKGASPFVKKNNLSLLELARNQKNEEMVSLLHQYMR